MLNDKDNEIWFNEPYFVGNDVYNFYKEKKDNKVWRVEHLVLIDKEKGLVEGNIDEMMGEILFSFDMKKIYNLWQDYPHNFTKEEKELFDKENPYWRDFFKNRK